MTENLTPVPLRSRPFHRHIPRWVSPVVFTAIILIWQMASSFGWVNPLALASPAEIWAQLVELYQSGGLAQHMGASVERLAIGWSLGTIFGVVTGVSIGLWTYARAGLLPLVSALFPVPKIALLPLFVVWFGIGEGLKLRPFFLACIFRP